MDFIKKTETLESLLASGKSKQIPLGLCITFNCPALVEMARPHNYSWLLLDLEHTELPLTGFVDIMRAADATGLPWFVKLPGWNPDLARDVLDFGASGLLVGFIERAEQLREMYEAIRFPPEGKRGWCSIARSVDHAAYLMNGRRQNRAEYFKFTNERALLIPTIETVKGANNLDELMKVEECPLWHIGPDDLGLDMLGADAPFDEDYAKEVYKVAVAIERKMHAAGKMLTTIFTAFPGARARGLDDLTLLNTDMPYVMDAWAYGLGLAESRIITDDYRARLR